MKRARLFLALVLLFSIGNCFTQYANYFAFLVYSVLMWIFLLITSIYCYARIFFVLRNHTQAQVIPQSQPNGISQLNFSRYRKTVSTALWVFATLVICYLPFVLVLITRAILSEIAGSLVIIFLFGITLVYLNSSLNPLLYCWKIREVRHAVKEILRNLGFGKLFGDWRTKRLEEATSWFVHDGKLSQRTSFPGSPPRRFPKMAARQNKPHSPTRHFVKWKRPFKQDSSGNVETSVAIVLSILVPLLVYYCFSVFGDYHSWYSIIFGFLEITWCIDPRCFPQRIIS